MAVKVQRGALDNTTELQETLAHLELVECSTQDVIRLATLALIEAIDQNTDALETLARAADPTGVYAGDEDDV